MQYRPAMKVAFLAVALAVAIGACAAPSEPSHRIDTTLPEGGYALFRAEPRGAKRVAFMVEMREAPVGQYVLLHTASEPASTGWFAIDPSRFSACSSEIEITCVVPDGRGAVVDAASVVEGGPPDLVLRHELAGDPQTSTGWYAVMRVDEHGKATPMAVEATDMDKGAAYDAPTVEQIW